MYKKYLQCSVITLTIVSVSMTKWISELPMDECPDGRLTDEG